MTELLIEGRRVRVSDDFKSLSPEQQAAEVDAIAQQIGITPQEKGSEGFFPQANRSIARGIDAISPFNAARAGLNRLVGTDLPTDVRAGTDSFEGAGIPVADSPPEGIVERAGAGMGTAAAALLPASGALKLASGASGMVGQLSDDALRALSSIPGALIEFGAGAGAGGLGEVAADTFGEGARPYGEIVGGMGVPMAGMAAGAMARGAQKLPVVGGVSNTLQRTVMPFAGPGARVAATNRARGVAEDPSAAAESLAGENVGNLTPAQQSGDPGLASLENRLAAESPEFARELRAGTERSAAILRENLEAIGGRGDVNSAVDFIASRREAFNKRLTGMVRAAQERADARIAKLSPERQQSANSVIVREEIDKAYGAAKNQERNLWSRIPQDVEVPTEGARARFQALVDETPTALADDIPDEARRMFASNRGVSDQATVREMLGLVSRMRQVAREARSGETPNPNRARIADDIANGVLDDLEQLPTGSQNVAKAIAEARTFSRELSETFKQGAVNTVRSKRSTGRGSVPPEAALGATVGAGGPRAAVAARDMRTATGGASDAPTEDFLRGQVSDRAVRGDQFSDRAAETFQKQNRDVLDEFPSVRDDLQGARDATAEVQARQDRVKSITERLNDRRQSVGAAFLQAAPGKEIAEAVFAARNPAKAALQIRNAAAKDTSGRALDGIKSGFLDNLIRGTSTSRLDAENVPMISGSRLTGRLADENTRAALKRIFKPDELRRMDQLAAQLSKIETAGRSGQATAIIDDLPNKFLSTFAQVQAASVGSAVARNSGTGNIQTPGIFVNRTKELLGKLTNDRAEQLLVDAIKDPELMRALLLNLDDPRAARRAADRLNSWLIGTGAVSVTEEE